MFGPESQWQSNVDGGRLSCLSPFYSCGAEAMSLGLWVW